MLISQHPIRVPTLEDNFNENLSFQEDVTTLAKNQTLLNYFLSLIFASNEVYIKDIKKVEEKLLKIIRDGKDKVHVISDFDMTITKYWHQGKRSPSSHDILSNSSKVSQKYHERCIELKEHYYPIEISSELNDAQKLPYMVEWWKNAHQAILDEHIHKDSLKTMVEETPVVFRPGIKNVLYTCKNKNIPFLVFSAGIQNVIQETLKYNGLFFNNMNVVSNKMLFNKETGICDRFVEPIIHVLNKDNFGLEGTAYGKLLENRQNVIVCGDSLGDLKMADGIAHDTCLSIGFLNLNKEKMLDKYKEQFDIVICDDGSFDILNELLTLLI